jgi:ribokinase
MPKVVVIGSANMDLTVRLERLPQLGETISGGEFYTSFGGKGANQAVAAHKAGAEVRFLAKLGRDQNGDAIINNLEALGLTSEGMFRDESHHSGVALIMVDRMGNNAIAVAPGSNWNLTQEDIRQAELHVSWGQVLLAQLEIPLPTVEQALRMAKVHSLVTILNPAPARPLPAEVLSLVDILTPNEMEIETLTGIRVDNVDEAARAGKKLLESGAKQVIVTLGREGSCWVRKNRSQTFPSFPAEAVDSTAAGDAFNGALACAVAEERPIQEAIRLGNAAGAIAVTRKGAQDSLPTREEMMNLLVQSRG